MTTTLYHTASMRASKQLTKHFQHGYATATGSAKLNRPIQYAASKILHRTEDSARKAYGLSSTDQVAFQNLHGAINASLRRALKEDEDVLVFGEDVAFGGVFRCSKGLADEFGSTRVFNTPLSEQAIIGFGIGAAAQGLKPVAEIQFADYIYPAFDQLVNEAAKFRFREGNTGGSVGGLVVRTPCGSIGHGAMYHSQSPEALFSHIPGLRVLMPRSPSQATGLLLNAILKCQDPVLFMEPKALYRAAEEYVPQVDFEVPLDKAEILRPGTDLTVISYGQPLYICEMAINALEAEIKGLRIELIDLRSIYPWDRATILESVRRTGRAVIVHESMYNNGVGAEVAASIQEGALLKLEAPVARVTGWATHIGLAYEAFNAPDVVRVYDAVKETLEY